MERRVGGEREREGEQSESSPLPFQGSFLNTALLGRGPLTLSVWEACCVDFSKLVGFLSFSHSFFFCGFFLFSFHSSSGLVS